MFGFVLSLTVMSVMFTLSGGAAFILRRTLMRGREGRMYPVWIALFAISVIPIRFNLPDIKLAEVANYSAAADISDNIAQSDSHFDLQQPIEPGVKDSSDLPRQNENLAELHLRRFLVAFAENLDMLTSVLFLLWLSGATINFIVSMNEYFSAKRTLYANSTPLCDERLMSLIEKVRADCRLKRRVEVRVFDDMLVASPCVSGCLKPILYIESGAKGLDDDKLRYIIAHELTHIKRHDILIKLFSLFTAAVHWLNPATRSVLRAVYEDCELSCDSRVISIYGKEISGVYMGAILDFAERFSENSRLIGAPMLNGGLFVAPPSGARYLKRRYVNMKGFRKDRVAGVLTALFCTACAVSSTVALSACSDITPGFFENAIVLDQPVEQMVRAYYGLTLDDFITPDMVDGITQLEVRARESADGKIYAEFVVNGLAGFASPQPNYSKKVYWEDCTAMAEAITDYEGGADRQRTDLNKINAFYQLKDPSDPMLTERARAELLAMFPILNETGALYFFDPYASEREINEILTIYDRMGVADLWEVGSYEFDASSLMYFTNLREVTFVGFTPVNYDFPETIKVTLVDTQPIEVDESGSAETDESLDTTETGDTTGAVDTTDEAGDTDAANGIKVEGGGRVIVDSIISTQS